MDKQDEEVIDPDGIEALLEWMPDDADFMAMQLSAVRPLALDLIKRMNELHLRMRICKTYITLNELEHLMEIAAEIERIME